MDVAELRENPKTFGAWNNKYNETERSYKASDRLTLSSIMQSLEYVGKELKIVYRAPYFIEHNAVVHLGREGLDIW
jgi:hypothetical protein